MPKRPPDPEREALLLEYQTRIGARAAELRGLTGLTLERLSRLCGISDSRIAKIELGRINLSVRTLVRVADALGAPLHELLVPADLQQIRAPEDLKKRRPKPSDPKREAGVDDALAHIGRRIAEFRSLQGFTLGHMEELCGVPSSRMSKIERGLGNVSLRTAVAISDALGVQLHELFVPPEISEIRTQGVTVRRYTPRKTSGSR